MFWIYGGGMRVGATREPIYDGEELAKKGVVVVTVNYRLGPFGFLAHPELSKESSHHASGNYGLLDQNAALKWVQKNIAAFGGDPSKVTIFGQSGGAYAVTSQVASPLSKGLFRGAIIQSLRMGYRDTPMASLHEAEQTGVKLANAAGAKSLAELRGLPADKVLEAGKNLMPVGIVDGWFFPQASSAILAQGKQNKVVVMIGSNSDEGQRAVRSALYGDKFSPHAATYVERAKKEYGPDAAKYLSLYPGKSDDQAQLSQQYLFADLVALGLRNVATELTRSGSKVFAYYYSYLDCGEYNAEGAVPKVRIGADHGAELPYVFGLLNHWKKPVPASDLKLQGVMMAYWTNFAKTLDPNGPGLPVWKPFFAPDVMVMDKAVGMQKRPRATQLDFLAAHPGEP